MHESVAGAEAVVDWGRYAQSQDHNDQAEGQERDGGDHRVESNGRRPGHGIVFLHPFPRPHGESAAGIDRRDLWACARTESGMRGSFGIDEVKEAVRVPVRPAFILPPNGLVLRKTPRPRLKLDKAGLVVKVRLYV